MQEFDDETALTNDDLGEAGESMFKVLCARSRLNCIKSDRDRTGWDFIVEYPLARSGREVTLDQRQKTTCNIQLKSTAVSGKRSISLKLSAAELLAKDAHPSLIIIFHFNKKGDLVRGHLIHFLDAPLHRLLHRLRVAEGQGRHDTHNLTISFDLRKYAISFEASPEGLKNALSQACGDNPLAYAQEKIIQINTLGYEGPELKSVFTFWVEDEAHFSRALLGQVPVKPIELKTFDMRFGIAVPYEGDLLKAAKGIFLTPEHGSDCVVIVKGPPLEPAASFKAELFSPPPIDGRMRMRIRRGGFEFTVIETETQFVVNCNYTFKPTPLEEVTLILKAMDYIMGGAAQVHVSISDKSWGPLNLPQGSQLTSDGPGDLPRLAKFAMSWKKLLDFAGVHSTALISWDDLWGSDAHLAVELMLEVAPTARFEFDADGIPLVENEVTAIYFNNAAVAGEAIHYAVEVTLVRDDKDPTYFRSRAFRPLEARPSKIDLDRYFDDLSSRYKFQVCIHPKHLLNVKPDQMRNGASS